MHFIHELEGADRPMRSVTLRLLTALAIASAPVALAACGGDADGSSEAASGEYEPVTAAPSDAESGGTLEVIAADDVDSIDPGTQYYQFSYMISGATQRTLVGWPPDETKEPQPDLAADEPELSEDG